MGLHQGLSQGLHLGVYLQLDSNLDNCLHSLSSYKNLILSHLHTIVTFLYYVRKCIHMTKNDAIESDATYLHIQSR